MELLPFHHHKLFLDVKSIMNLIVQVSGSITPSYNGTEQTKLWELFSFSQTVSMCIWRKSSVKAFDFKNVHHILLC